MKRSFILLIETRSLLVILSSLALGGMALSLGLGGDGAQFWMAGDLASGSGPPGAAFGTATATGDFDNDGELDLAIGDPFADVGGSSDAGAVYVAYGDPPGLTALGSQVWTQDSGTVENSSEPNDLFGFALATGNFNGDDYDDLAIGIPGETINGDDGAGAVAILFGSLTGLTDVDDQFWHEDASEVVGVTAPGDAYGYALAAGYFGDDSYEDLAIGIPGQDGGGKSNSGGIQVFYGSGIGLTSADEENWEQGFNGLAETLEVGDGFGRALAAGDFRSLGRDDLAIGVPYEDLIPQGGGNGTDVGAVHLVLSAPGGLTSVANQFWHQRVGTVVGGHDGNERFGTALAAGDFDADGRADLAIGAPGEPLGSGSDAGWINVLFGHANGLTDTDNQVFSQGFGGLLGTEGTGHRFGQALTSGDFDGDGYADVAVGAPGDVVTAVAGAGSATVIYGASGGLAASGNQYWNQSDAAVADTPEASDAFGSALAAGDFDGDAADDLAVAVPFEDGAGAVNVLFGDACGNGVVQGQEQCDDGNEASEDGCSDQCLDEFCSDGTLQAGLGEQCDDGNLTSDDGCSDLCVVEFCGDGIVHGGLGEECDDGGTSSDDGCSALCIVEFCGDGITQNGIGEECDDGANAGGDGCAAACWVEESSHVVHGTAMGGRIDLVVEGVALSVDTIPGQSAAEVLAAVAAAINADPTLSTLGVQAAVVGGVLYIGGASSSFEIFDPGIFSAPISAVITPFTDEAAFTAALPPGSFVLEDFESLVAGDPVGALGGITFTEGVDAEGAAVTDRYDTTSPTLSLGLENPDDALQDGDWLFMEFDTAVDAAGVLVVTSDPPVAGEILLVTPHGKVPGAATPAATLEDGGLVYFLGLVSDTPFDRAVLAFDSDGEVNFVHTIDDVRYVPEPGSWLSLSSTLAGLWLLAGLGSRRARRGSCRPVATRGRRHHSGMDRAPPPSPPTSCPTDMNAADTREENRK
jgi:cysteine-rich repeat protein